MRYSHVVFLVLVLALSSCGGNEADSSSPASVVSSSERVVTTTTTTAAESEGPAEATFLRFDRSIELATATEGGGIRPLLEWGAVSGADHYGVYLYVPDGRLYWSWRGRELSVYVGGAVQIGDHAAGPAIAAGMSWAVVAYDEDLNPIAASDLRPIAP